MQKTGTPHVLPLARQPVAILRELHLLTGQHRYAFPNARYARDEHCGCPYEFRSRTAVDQRCPGVQYGQTGQLQIRGRSVKSARVEAIPSSVDLGAALDLANARDSLGD